MTDIRVIDPLWDSRSIEDKAALRAGALSDPARKVQRFGLPCHWRACGPFDWTGCEDVVVLPGRLSGVPTVGNSRFSADNLLELHESGMTVHELVDHYQSDRHIVERVLAFAELQKQAIAA